MNTTPPPALHSTAAEEWAAVVAVPFGRMGLLCSASQVQELRFLPPDTPIRAASTALGRQAVAALEQWFASPTTAVPFPCAPRGTAFQQRVWQALRDIPLGERRTYGALALQLNSSARAVGQACGRNPFPLFTPCHRVVAASGGLGGFAHAQSGYLLDIKRWLLDFESTR